MKHPLRPALLLLALALGGCLGQGSQPSAPPANFSVAPGESQVVLNWTADPNLTYWIYYSQGSTTGLGNADHILFQVTPPYDLTGLTNNTQYAFAVTASDNGSQVGPFTPVVTATPRLIGPQNTWTVGTPLGTGTNNLNAIAYGVVNGTGTYVAVGDGAQIWSAPFSYTSKGGVTGWTPQTSPVSGVNLTGIVYDGTRFVALGAAGTVLTSSDGTTWTAATAIAVPSGTVMHAIAYGNGVYVAVGDNGVIDYNGNAGVSGNWTPASSGTPQNLYGVAFLNGQFVAVGAQGTVVTSPDGITWTVQTSAASATTNALRAVAYGVVNGTGTYVAVGDAGTVLSSTDAVNWTKQSPNPTRANLKAIAFGPDAQFVAVGTAGTTVYGTTGTSWASNNVGTNQDLYAIAPNAVYIAVGVADTNVSAK